MIFITIKTHNNKEGCIILDDDVTSYIYIYINTSQMGMVIESHDKCIQWRE